MTAHPTRRSRRLVLAAILVLGMSIAMAAPSLAQDSLDVQVHSAKVLEDGTTRLVVDVTGITPDELTPENVTVTEGNDPVDGIQVQLASDVEEPEPRTVIVAMDTSASTSNGLLASAKEAVKTFVADVVERNVSVGLVEFSRDTEVLVEPTTDASRLNAALDELRPGGGTELYDAVHLSALQLQDVKGQRSIVVFSDGNDNGSEVSGRVAVQAATVVGVSVTSVALVSPEFSPDTLEAMADSTGGRVVAVDNADDLTSAFAQVAQDLSSQYIVTYPSTGRTGEFEVQLVVQSDGQRASDTMPVLNNLSIEAGTPPTSQVVAAPGGLLRPSTLPWLLGVLGVGLAFVLAMLLIPGRDRLVARTMRAAIVTTDRAEDREEISAATAALSRQAIQMVERIPKPEGYDERLQQDLDRAGWPMRSGEFTTLRMIAVVMGGLVGGGVFTSWLTALVLAVLGLVIPRAVLRMRVDGRRKDFMEQLPDTLQLIAGSLKAGYGVLQAVDTVVRETQEPTKAEFQRVLTEARLGLPLEDALGDMAERIDADDFRWVAVAINIQRRVGGNLAQLLDTVAKTLRERAGTRRQIKALSAEGRLSAVILVVLPFGLAGYMAIVQPSYIGQLVVHPIGQALLALVTVLMIAGIFWMKRMIDIDV